jgi:hypothetical protein
MKLSDRLKRRSFTLAITSGALLEAVSCTSRGGSGAPMRSNLSSAFTLSPDGRLVAFNAGTRGVGLYDWRVREIRYVPIRPQFSGLGWPNYSSDGRRLAGVATISRAYREGSGAPEYNLGVIDLSTEEMISFPMEKIFHNPVFRPNGNAILYLGRSSRVVEERPFLFDLRTQTSSELLSENNGFYAILRPSFVSDDTVLFVGMGPSNPDLKAAVQGLGYTSVGHPVPYLLKIGSKPEIAYLDVLDRYLDGLKTIGLPSSMPASRNGQRIVFIGLSQGQAARKAYRSGDVARYELFAIEGQQARQVTHLENYLAFVAISQDGSTAAFGLHTGPLSDVRNLGRGKIPLELAVADLNTGQVTRTDFVERKTADLSK